ncbi:maleylpyruvate isomerase N-terminal domain-containing protein [soil metagenome]
MVSVSSAALFSHSANAFLDLLSEIRDDLWSSPALGVWDVRSLAGHTARAILTVENYLGQEEPGDITIASAEAYYANIYAQFTDPAAVAERGVEAGAWLGDDPVGQVSAALLRTRSEIESQPANRLVSIGGMGILLTEYLRTRNFELVVHTLDLARATGVAHTIPQSSLTDALALATASAVQHGSGEALLLALTGRAPLPDGFSVV